MKRDEMQRMRCNEMQRCDAMKRNRPPPPNPSPRVREGGTIVGRCLRVVVLAVVFVLVAGDLAAHGAGVAFDGERLRERLAVHGQHDAVRAGRGGSAPEAAAKATA